MELLVDGPAETLLHTAPASILGAASTPKPTHGPRPRFPCRVCRCGQRKGRARLTIAVSCSKTRMHMQSLRANPERWCQQPCGGICNPKVPQVMRRQHSTGSSTGTQLQLEPQTIRSHRRHVSKTDVVGEGGGWWEVEWWVSGKDG